MRLHTVGMPLNAFHRPWASCLLLACPVALPTLAFAADAPTTLPTVSVSARVESVAAFDLPASLDVVDLRADPWARASLPQALGSVPGVLVRERQNLAQDTQLSIRGFGARATFGVRGVRLYSDGIPATMPDGQGQLSHFALAAGDRIEVIRGPFSALHGNSSGGVVQLWTAQGHAPGSMQLHLSGASHATRTASLRLDGGSQDQATGYRVSAWRLDTDGYRDHSAARRTLLDARLSHALRDGGELKLVGNLLDAPDAQDPLGLDRAQWRANPRQATPQALQYDTRKSVRQGQLGAHWRQPLGSTATVHATAYGGQRTVTQFLAVPVAAQASPLSGGGVIDLDSGYGGMDARATWQWGDGNLELTVGASAERQDQHRRGYENFDGARLGVRGALRRDQDDVVSSMDQYAQAWWRMTPRWWLQAGARHSRVRFRSHDRYITTANPDDSGRVDYSQVTPVAGVTFAPGPDLRLYVSAGRGFETPTFNELAYRADGRGGLALELRPAVSDNLELGAKWRSPSANAQLEAALFRADTRDELAVARNSGGRSSYRNAGHARRQGLELSAQARRGRLGVQLAGTWLDARFRDGFPFCAGAGCTVPNAVVPAGARIPGLPRRHGLLRLDWDGGQWRTALELAGASAVNVDDRGLASAPGHALLHLQASRDWRYARGTLRGLLRVGNLLDRRHVGSVIVNEGNGRYYEPGPGRSLLLGLEWLP